MATGLADDLLATVDHVQRGTVSQSYARGQIERAERWLAGLAGRPRMAYLEEAAEVTEALVLLRDAARRMFIAGVAIMFVPERQSKTQAVMSQAAAFANLAMLNDARVLGRKPNALLPATPVLLPSVAVQRLCDGYVRRQGRARVETVYELLVGGRRALTGSRRYVMRQADWAVMCDATGTLPLLERLTGKAKRRALYKARKARRRPRRYRSDSSAASSPHQNMSLPRTAALGLARA